MKFGSFSHNISQLLQEKLINHESERVNTYFNRTAGKILKKCNRTVNRVQGENIILPKRKVVYGIIPD